MHQAVCMRNGDSLVIGQEWIYVGQDEANRFGLYTAKGMRHEKGATRTACPSGGQGCFQTCVAGVGASCSRAGLTATQRNLGHALAGDAHFCVNSHNASSFISHPRLLAACRPRPETVDSTSCMRMGHFQPQNTLHSGVLKNCGQN